MNRSGLKDSAPPIRALREQKGFTLIELMIVVGIIGILVSIASPRYERFQRKARQSEAKIALAGMFGLEKSFYGEYSAYIPSFDAIGYMPEGTRRFYFNQVSIDAAVYAGTVNGYAGSVGTPWISTLNSPFAWGGAYSAGTTCDVTTNTAAYGNIPQTFLMIAQGNLYSSTGVIDRWEINETKNLRNCSTGI